MATLRGGFWFTNSAPGLKAKESFGRLTDTACAIEKHGRHVVVVLSVEDSERPKSNDQRRLAHEYGCNSIV
jgi:hypothetical protein